jgi:hypothetical protein
VGTLRTAFAFPNRNKLQTSTRTKELQLTLAGEHPHQE